MKIIKINSCEDCPYTTINQYTGAMTCIHKDRAIPKGRELFIPVWCPLEDASQQDFSADLPCTCPKNSLGIVMVRAHDCPKHGNKELRR